MARASLASCSNILAKASRSSCSLVVVSLARSSDQAPDQAERVEAVCDSESDLGSLADSSDISGISGSVSLSCPGSRRAVAGSGHIGASIPAARTLMAGCPDGVYSIGRHGLFMAE